MEKLQDQFLSFLKKVAEQRGNEIPELILSVDPGETTGYAFFREGKLESCGQLKVKKEGIGSLHSLYDVTVLVRYDKIIDYVIVEDYKVYPTKLKQHILSGIFPVKVIGALEYMFSMHDIPVVLQMADTAKGFVTNEKLREWGMWAVGQEHARDAVRHGAYWLCFGRR